MDALPEIAVRLVGGFLRIVAQFVLEFLLEFLAEPIGRLISAPYRFIRNLVVRWVPGDLLATPVALLCFAALTAVLFYGVVKVIQLALI